MELEDKFPILRSKSGNDTHVELHYLLKEVAKLNIIVWELSVLGGEIITELVNEKKIHFKPMDSMSRLCYIVDGGGLNLPMVNRPTKQGYKEPHWIPCWVVTKKILIGRAFLEMEEYEFFLYIYCISGTIRSKTVKPNSR